MISLHPQTSQVALQVWSVLPNVYNQVKLELSGIGWPHTHSRRLVSLKCKVGSPVLLPLVSVQHGLGLPSKLTFLLWCLGLPKSSMKWCTPRGKHFQLLFLLRLMYCYWPESVNIVRSHITKKEVIQLFYKQTTSKPKTFLKFLLLKISIPFSISSRRFCRKCPTKTR